MLQPSIHHTASSMAISLLRCTPFSPARPHNFFQSNQFPNYPLKIRQHYSRPRALTEWREYEEAVKEKDLGRALRFLQDIPQPTDDNNNNKPLGLMELQRDWDVLDTCLNADDLRLVAAAYAFLKDKGFLNQFAKYRSIGNIL